MLMFGITARKYQWFGADFDTNFHYNNPATAGLELRLVFSIFVFQCSISLTELRA